MKLKKTKLINIYGGPGAGKSTTAAGVFYELKKLGYSCGLVTEMATELVYDEAFNVMNDQIYLFGEQWHRTNRMLGKVDYIVTDSPFLLNIIYDRSNDEPLHELVLSKIAAIPSYNYFVKRGEDFSEGGRVHNLEQSKEKDKEIISLCEQNYINLTFVEQNNSVMHICSDIIKKESKLEY